MMDGSSYEIVTGREDARVLFICDHASNRVPDIYGNLGLPAAQFERHIAYDIGAAAITRRLAEAVEAPAVLSTISRLLIDPNRGDDDPTLVMRISDGVLIPRNARIDAAEIGHRRRTYWQPYRDAIVRQIDTLLARGNVPVIISIHSFTPLWKGVARPWDIGILWDKDPRLALPLIDMLRAKGLKVGDNEPYDGALKGDTLYDLATLRGLPHVLVEFRQDLVGDAAGVERWARIALRALQPSLRGSELTTPRFYGSRARSS